MLIRSLLAALAAGSFAAPIDPLIVRDAGENRIALVVREAAPSVDGRTRVIASTDGADRYDDVVDQGSWKLDRYRANPVILWSHDRSQPPVGKCVAVAIVENKLVMDIEWDESSELGAQVARQFREGFLSAVSVGFRPGRVIGRSQLPKDDPRYKENGYGVVYYDNELLETSAVTVPANADALAIARSAAQGDLLSRALDAEGAQEQDARKFDALQRSIGTLASQVAALSAKLDAVVAGVEGTEESVRQMLDESAERGIVDSEGDAWFEDGAPKAGGWEGWPTDQLPARE